MSSLAYKGSVQGLLNVTVLSTSLTGSERLLSGCTQPLRCQQKDPYILFGIKTIPLGFNLIASHAELTYKKVVCVFVKPPCYNMDF